MTEVTVSGLTADYGKTGSGKTGSGKTGSGKTGSAVRTAVLDGLDLQIPAGAITAVLGASGSGKTTLLRVLAGFLRPRRGTVRFGDRIVAGDEVFVPPEKRRVGIVPQEGALFPHLSVADNVGFGLPRGSQARIAQVLALVGMADHAQARPHELSGGQQQRVALARALAPEPDVILLDEPFSSLDAALRTRLRTEVRDMLRAAGSTTVLVTHDQDEALSIADRVAVMRDGRIVQAGTPRQVYDEPTDLGVARFVGEAVELAATADPASASVSCALGEVRVHHGGAGRVTGPAVVVLRPEQLAVSGVGTASNPPASPGSGIVREAVFHGHDSLLWVELADGLRVPVRVPGGGPTPGPGEAVVVEVIGEGMLYPS